MNDILMMFDNTGGQLQAMQQLSIVQQVTVLLLATTTTTYE